MGDSWYHQVRNYFLNLINVSDTDVERDWSIRTLLSRGCWLHQSTRVLDTLPRYSVSSETMGSRSCSTKRLQGDLQLSTFKPSKHCWALVWCMESLISSPMFHETFPIWETSVVSCCPCSYPQHHLKERWRCVLQRVWQTRTIEGSHLGQSSSPCLPCSNSQGESQCHKWLWSFSFCVVGTLPTPPSLCLVNTKFDFTLTVSLLNVLDNM